jgi:hypothetical protein
MHNHQPNVFDLYFASSTQGLLASSTSESRAHLGELIHKAAQIAEMMIEERGRAAQASALSDAFDGD